MNDAELTPVQRIGDYWFKRDDLFETCGVHGGKARAAYDQITKAVSDGFNGIATAGARESPQCEIVSSICEKLGIRCALFMPSGKPTSVMENICGNRLSTIFPQRARYNNVLCSRPEDKLQFNIDTVKLANLPGLFNTLKSEGVFFKPIANRWNAGEVDECGVDRLGESDDTLSNALDELHYCTDSFWVNPKYANKKVSSLGGIGSRVIAEDGKTSVCLWVYYLEKDGTVIAWDMDVD